MRVIGGYFRLEVEAVSSHEIHYLELSAERINGSISCKHKAKPGALSIPLSIISSHSPTVHRSWPVGMIKNICQLSPNVEEAADAVQKMHERLRDSMIPFFWPDEDVINKLIATLGKVSPTPRSDPQTDTLWFPFPLGYHPTIAKTLSRTLHDFVNKHPEMTHRALAELSPTADYKHVKFAWRNVEASLATILVRRLRVGRPLTVR